MILGFVYKIYNKYRLDTYLSYKLVYIKPNFKDYYLIFKKTNKFNIWKNYKNKLRINVLNKFDFFTRFYWV